MNTTLKEVAYEGMSTPWGRADNVETITEGIWFVSTPSHGGIVLDKAHKSLMPKPFRNNKWYEEDCEAGKVIITFPEAFKESTVKAAHASVKNWFPVAYEQVYNVTIPLSESL